MLTFFFLKAFTAYSFSSASTTGQNCNSFNFKSFSLLTVFVELYMYTMSLLN